VLLFFAAVGALISIYLTVAALVWLLKLANKEIGFP